MNDPRWFEETDEQFDEARANLGRVELKHEGAREYREVAGDRKRSAIGVCPSRSAVDGALRLVEETLRGESSGARDPRV